MAAIPDFARKFGLVLKACNLSRARVAQIVGIDKSVISRWASGIQAPTDHNLSLLTDVVVRHRVDFGRSDWDLDVETFAARLSPAAAEKPSTTPAPVTPPAIAVLPFTNMGGDAEQEYFADGITEDIITALAKWRSFLVIARNSTFAYKGRSVDVRQVGRELGARYVLEGSVRRSANRVRVTAQLIDAANAAHLWAERYDRELTDIFALQDEISRHIATVIEPELGRYERTQSAARPPANLDAWDCLHRGLHLLYKFTRTDIEAARMLLTRAVALDPNLARAQTSLAYTHQADLVHGFSDDRAHSIELLLDHARRGVALDDSDSYSHVMLAFGYRWAKNYALALAEARKAVEVNPNDSWAIGLVGLALDLLGRHGEGLEHMERAIALLPRDPHVKFYLALGARSLIVTGEFARAEEWARRAIAFDPGQARPYMMLAIALAAQGRVPQGRSALDACETIEQGCAARWAAANEYADQAANDRIVDGLRLVGM